MESVGLMRMRAGVLNVEGGVLMAAAVRKRFRLFPLAPSVPRSGNPGLLYGEKGERGKRKETSVAK